MSESLAAQNTERAEAPAAPYAALGLDDFDRDIWCVLGLPFDRADIAGAAEAVSSAARTGRRLSIVTPNTNWLVRAKRDASVRRQILNADLSLADGAPVVAIARMLGVPLPGRAAGADLFEALKARPAIAGRRLRVFFFGGRDGAADAAAAVLEAGNFGVEAAGSLNPGHGDLESMSRPEIARQINDARPDFVLVALGAGKGQAWIERNFPALTAPVIAHLGAVVDFTAGSIRRAPKWMARAGLEWAWRIKEERSLWRRYAEDGAALAALLLRQALPQLALARGAIGSEASARLERSDGQTRIILSGALVRDGLSPVRRAFREAVAEKQDITLDVAKLSSCDRAFLGLVLMLEKSALEAGKKLRVSGASRAFARTLALNGMSYADAGADIGAKPAGARVAADKGEAAA